MKKNWKAKLIPLVCAIGIAGVLPVAQVSAATPEPTTTTPAIGAQLQIGKALGGIRTFMADLLKLDVADLQQLRIAGQSWLEIAAPYGYDEDQLMDAIVKEREAILQQKVEDGSITQEQADLCSTTMNDRVNAQLERTEVGPAGNGQGKALGNGQRNGMGQQNGMGQGNGMKRGWN
ncbi:hypothetical protein [Rubeoparvulum massiliense]|uniref:hypothetical protein n=1 Tax=Rubeoparvulum massiliense TaxID=1631346 RepID=UPI00065E8B9F|nr:hypothetical protein [Rubeoparvulum massiliense]